MGLFADCGIGLKSKLVVSILAGLISSQLVAPDKLSCQKVDPSAKEFETTGVVENT